MNIAIDHLQDGAVLTLIEAHLADMYATSPPNSVHALNVASLRSPEITFWCGRGDNDEPLGCIALKQLTDSTAEIKSMRTTEGSRGKGVGTALLKTLLSEASGRGYTILKLETGSQDFFKPACRLYEKFGFQYCGPFDDYTDDPNSLFMVLNLLK